MGLDEVLHTLGFKNHDDSGLTPLEKVFHHQKASYDIAAVPLKQWDKGVFSTELRRQKIVPNVNSKLAGTVPSDRTEPLSEGTYGGTQLAITEFYDRMERAFSSAFEALGIEKVIPQMTGLEEKQNIFKFSYGPDGKLIDSYPPHLLDIPSGDSKDNVSVFTIFNKLGLIGTALIVDMIIPHTFLSDLKAAAIDGIVAVAFGNPYHGPTLANVERYNNGSHQTGTDVMRGKNIGNEPDWYSDAKFAQQWLTGVNPMSLTLASEDWISGFQAQAELQKLDKMLHLLTSADKKSIYVADYHVFRDAIKVAPDDTKGMSTTDNWGTRYGCASVILFQLNDDGKIHPLGIIIDWKGSWEKSVTIFNNRLSPDEFMHNEKEDWPWRYAKTCAQVSDWAFHEVWTHLVHTHFIEESSIVATHRQIPENHMVFKLLDPHWFRTLSLNAAARKTLVPQVISKLLGISTDKTDEFIKYGYKNFNWVDNYVPNDLAKRGFPPDQLEEKKFRNCAYAKDISLMWGVLRQFVKGMLSLAYANDEEVKNDKYVKNWCEEMRSDHGGQISTFPLVETIDELADTVTMCIHLASPQHTAVNYLQNYYQAFVAARPPALCEALPTTLDELKKYDEKNFTAALPIGDRHSKQWLLAAQLPHLLSFKVADEYNILTYAHSLWHLYMCKNGKDEDGIDQDKVRELAKELWDNLMTLEETFHVYSNQMTSGTVPYTVLNPKTTAVSILI